MGARSFDKSIQPDRGGHGRLSAEIEVNFVLNGRSISWRGDPNRRLLDWLRDDLGLTSVKRGCAPQGSCGACTVSIDGRAQLACTFKMRRAEGRDIRTLEGMDARRVGVLADALAAHGAVQCGFCTPGITMRAALLLSGGGQPSRSEVAKAMAPHVCRCTGWTKILDAIVEVGRAGSASAVSSASERILSEISAPSLDRSVVSGEVAGAVESFAGVLESSAGVLKSSAGVGARLDKLDARALALGQRAFVADLRRPDMLHGAMVLTDHARARILGLDLREAEALPGVVRVLTASDVPGERFIGLLRPDWPVFVDVGEQTACVGDCLALVVAQDRAIARQAAELVRVSYEVHEPLTDVFAALAPEAPALHPGGNLLSRTVFGRGQVDEALREAAYVVRNRYETQRVEHAFLEVECCLAEPLDGGGVHIFSQTQGVYEDRRQIASLLGLPEAEVRVTLVPTGGAFGGKEDLSVQGQAAVAAWVLDRPISVELSRDESIRIHAKRHPFVMDWELGCDAKGRLLGLRARIVGDTGGRTSVGAEVLARAAGHATGAYDLPAVDIEALAVFTNNPPSGAFRGFGVAQVNFAMESAIDELCELGGFDRWQLRWDNALREGSRTATGQLLGPGVGVRACLEAVRPAFEASPLTGVAAGMKNVGLGAGALDEGRVRVDIEAPDRVRLRHGFTEMGQGVQTVAVQFLTERLKLDPRIIRVDVDTEVEAPVGMTTASRATSLLGHAILDACSRLLPDLQAHGIAGLVGRSYEGRWAWTWPAEGQEVVTHYSYGWAAQVAQVNAAGEIVKVTAAHDVGRVINPKLFEGQIEGAVHMGLGYALTEALPCDAEGWPLSTRLRDCGILSASQMPPVEVIAVETPDPNGPLGARGVGEVGLVPTAPAVAGALWSLEGRRARRLPIRPPRRRARRRRGQ